MGLYPPGRPVRDYLIAEDTLLCILAEAAQSGVERAMLTVLDESQKPVSGVCQRSESGDLVYFPDLHPEQSPATDSDLEGDEE